MAPFLLAFFEKMSTPSETIPQWAALYPYDRSVTLPTTWNTSLYRRFLRRRVSAPIEELYVD
jgi:hypothetical protein